MKRDPRVSFHLRFIDGCAGKWYTESSNMVEVTMKYRKWLDKHARRMEGKTILVTGGNSGIGYESARAFLYLGARVILACRSATRAAAATEKLRAEFADAQVETELVDIASFASIDAFVTRMQSRGGSIDVCLHCAGVYYPRDTETADGYPMTEGVNYIGTMRLADGILPLMHTDGRMVFTTSLVDRFGRPDRLPDKEGYDAYCRSKTLLSAEVIRRAAQRGADAPRFMAAHPGITATNLLSADKTTHKPFFSKLGHAFLYLFTHSPAKAALTGILAATGNLPNGTVVGPRGLFGISGYPHAVRFSSRARKCAAGKITTVHPTGART